MPVREVRDALLNEYDAEPQRCEQDLLSLLEELQSHDLLEVQPADSQAASGLAWLSKCFSCRSLDCWLRFESPCG